MSYTDYQTVLAASALVHTGKGLIAGILISPSAGAAGYLHIYDNTSAAGVKIFSAYCPTADHITIFFPLDCRPRFETGCYVEIRDVIVTLWALGA